MVSKSYTNGMSNTTGQTASLMGRVRVKAVSSWAPLPEGMAKRRRRDRGPEEEEEERAEPMEEEEASRTKRRRKRKKIRCRMMISIMEFET